jgi:hypothetical protein
VESPSLHRVAAAFVARPAYARVAFTDRFDDVSYFCRAGGRDRRDGTSVTAAKNVAALGPRENRQAVSRVVNIWGSQSTHALFYDTDVPTVFPMVSACTMR